MFRFRYGKDGLGFYNDSWNNGPITYDDWRDNTDLILEPSSIVNIVWKSLEYAPYFTKKEKQVIIEAFQKVPFKKCRKPRIPQKPNNVYSSLRNLKG